MDARARRARSLGRDGQPEVLDRLADVLEGIHLNQRNQPRNNFRPPTYRGDGDVELFIQHFQEVAGANGWNQVATLLHLRESLEDKAQGCSRAETSEGIFTALRARFGLTAREARGRLAGLKRDTRCPLHDHAVEVERLVRVAYAELPDHLRVEMTREIFCGSLGSVALQQHLLAPRPQTMEEAGNYGNEFLQVKGDRNQPLPKIGSVEETETDTTAAAGPEPMALLMDAIVKLTQKVDQLGSKAAKKEQGNKCWGCGKEGHTKKNCPTHPWPTESTSARSGNGTSPQ